MKLSNFNSSVILICLFCLTTPNIFSLSVTGTIDTLSFSALLLCLVFLLAMIKTQKMGLLFCSSIVSIIIILNLASILYFYMFNAYPVFGSILIVFEGLNQLSFFQSVGLVLVIVMIYLLSLFLTLQICSTPFPKQSQYALVFLLLFIAGQSIFTDRYKFSPVSTSYDVNALGFATRSFANFSFWAQDIESQQQQKLSALAVSLTPGDILPLELHHSNFKDNIDNNEEYSYPYPEQFPLYKIPNIESPPNGDNIIVLVLESVRSSEMGIYGAKESATPFLDSLASEASVFLNNYSTTTFTAKSELAIHCSMLDFISGGAISSRKLPILKKCLPSLLKEHNYKTFWFHGNNKEFYDRDTFLPGIGITNLFGLKEISKINNPKTIGWGLPDTDVFEKAFNVLENEKHPFYAEVLSVSNHTPFNFDWRIDIPDSINTSKSNYFNDYRHGIYYTDYVVSEFFHAFKKSNLAKNTHVIITGDHGIWTFDNTNQLSPITKNEQFYRVPLIIWSPDKQNSTHNKSTSHLDIAPTIMDLLDFKTKNSFSGVSLLFNSKPQENRTVFSMSNHRYSYRNKDKACIPMNSCPAGKRECSINDIKKSSFNQQYDMLCAPLNKAQNLQSTIQSDTFDSSADRRRKLLDYLQFSLLFPSEPLEDN
jgi:phosphoglycerol transferase MdoB-like AlkP superfamily enzyme